MLNQRKRTKVVAYAALAIGWLVLGSANGQATITERPKIHIGSASPAEGIVGTIATASTVVFFETKLDGATLRSVIRGNDGHQYWLYVEDLESPDPPRVEIDGKPFTGGYGDEMKKTLQRIGESTEGELIRVLAFDLSSAAAAPDLVAYRRGLETAYQAMQSGYPAEVRTRPPHGQPNKKLFVRRNDTGEITAAEMTGSHTADYIFSQKGGYVVMTQHPRTVFINNFLSDDHELVRSSVGKLPINGNDDDQIGDGCFGMCGNGCSSGWSCRGFQGWSHEWVTPPTTTESALCYCNRPQEIIDPDCSNFTPGSFKVTTHSTSGTAIHTITGWSSDGCRAHDWCCRTMWGGCFNPLCVAPGLVAEAECAAGIGWQVSWSYVGPLGYSYSEYDGTGCRYDCPECGALFYPDPIPIGPPPPPSAGGNPFVYGSTSDQSGACYGVASSYSAYCDSISDLNDRLMCQGLSLRSQSPCTQMSDRNMQLACYGMSLAPNYPSNCRDITDPQLQTFCYAVSGRSINTCTSLTDRNTQLLCYAMSGGTPSNCRDITDRNLKEFCYGVSSHNTSYCSIVGNGAGSSCDPWAESSCANMGGSWDPYGCSCY
jgi:hypothetical protein